MASTGKNTLVAAKDLVIDGLTIKAGSTLATIEQGVPADRIFNGLSNGAVIDKDTYDKQAAAKQAEKEQAEKPAPPAPPAPVPLDRMG